MGHQSASVMIYLIGLFMFILVFAFPVDVLVYVLVIAGIIFTFMSIVYINYLVSYNRLTPLINRINRENEIIWVRVTKDKLLTFQVAKKGVHGQTKGIMHGKKADVVDKGDFPIQCLNGNNAIIVYDRMSRNVNLDQAVAWKQLFKKHKVSTGKDAYIKSKKVHSNV